MLWLSVRFLHIDHWQASRPQCSSSQRSRSAPRALQTQLSHQGLQTLSVGSDPHRCSRADKNHDPRHHDAPPRVRSRPGPSQHRAPCRSSARRSEFGQPARRVENAPKLLRRAGLAETVASLDWRVNDEGDVDMQTTQDVAGPLRHAAQIGHGSRKLMEACVELHARGNFVLHLGGDHSVALGTVSAASRRARHQGALGRRARRLQLAFHKLRRATRTACARVPTQARAVVGARRGVVRTAWLDDVRLAPENLLSWGCATSTPRSARSYCGYEKGRLPVTAMRCGSEGHRSCRRYGPRPPR